jgi:hypothetical protein
MQVLHLSWAGPAFITLRNLFVLVILLNAHTILHKNEMWQKKELHIFPCWKMLHN